MNPDDTVWLTCPDCGEQQEDMGRGVECDVCGALMPDAPDHGEGTSGTANDSTDGNGEAP